MMSHKLKKMTVSLFEEIGVTFSWFRHCNHTIFFISRPIEQQHYRMETGMHKQQIIVVYADFFINLSMNNHLG